LKSSSALKSELVRKGIHILIAFVPFLASSIGRSHTALLMMGGILFYTCAESMRFLGFSLPLVSSVTGSVLRVREYGRFAAGPITLGLGSLLTMLLFPPAIAAAAIYALAFGDSAATLVGRFIGRFRPAFLSGKSVEGSLACFTFSFLPAYLVLRDWKSALAVGLAAMITDALPLKDFDNLLLPLAAGVGAVMVG
jgi:dolichol kinase